LGGLRNSQYILAQQIDGCGQTKDCGAHGYLSDDSSMQAIFIASGAAIKKGIRLPQISNVDVAPTIAALLGLDMKSASGPHDSGDP